jgi:hypothetical protein
MGGGEPRGLSLPTVAAFVCALHAHSGKTLLARVLAEHFILSGGAPLLFDTDALERRLAASFPLDAVVVDVAKVREQMILFDSLARPSPAPRVVDVAHQAARPFFKLLRETDFIAEARANGIAPALFYIADRDRRSREEAVALRAAFADCAFVVVENEFLPRPSAALSAGDACRTLAAHPLHVRMARLPDALVELIDDERRSLSALIRAPLSRNDQRGDLSFAAASAFRAWLMPLFRDIHRALANLDAKAEAMA